MDPALQAYAAAAAVIVGMLVFAGLVLLGVRIVAWLRLPNDLPDELRYAPPPPPPHAPGHGGDARAIAERQARLGAIYADALAVAERQAGVGELQMLVLGTAAEATVAGAYARIGSIRARVDTALADGAEASASAIAGARAEAESAYAEAERAAESIPRSNIRLWLLLGLAVVMVALLALTLALRPAP